MDFRFDLCEIAIKHSIEDRATNYQNILENKRERSLSNMDQEQLSVLAFLKATFSKSYKLQWKQNTALDCSL